jgi:hypothetical protein
LSAEISDWDAGPIIILCKAFNIRKSLHNGNSGGNGPSQDPEYGLGAMGPESLNIESISGLGIPNGYRDVSMPAGISIVNISSNSQNLYMK